MIDKPDANQRIQKSLNGRFLFVVGILFLVLYFVLGCAIIFWKEIPLQMPQNYKNVFGVLLIVYATIRFGRLIKTDKNK